MSQVNSTVTVAVNAIREFFSFIEQKNPDLLPKKDAVLTDIVIVEILKKILVRSGIGNHTFEDYRVFEEDAWVIELAGGQISVNQAIESISESMNTYNDQTLFGVNIWPESVHPDYFEEFVFCNSWIPIEIAIYGSHYFSFLKFDEVISTKIGDPPLHGMLAASMSPYLDGYSLRVQFSETRTDLLKSLDKFPVLALLAIHHYVPGFPPNPYLMSFEWNPEGEILYYSWEEIPELSHHRKNADMIFSIAADVKKKSPSWLFQQIVLTHKITSPIVEGRTK